MNEENLVMIGIHEETRNEKGELDIPASLIKIYESNEEDCFNEKYIAVAEQIYARRNKNMKDKKGFTVDDFKGAKGITENLYNKEGAKDFIQRTIDDGYRMIRIPRQLENRLADELFEYVMRHEMSKRSMKMNF